MNDNRHQLSPAAATEYMMAGHGKATLVGRETRFTFKFSHPENREVVFVALLVGSDNEADYEYLGFIGRSGLLQAGRKGNPKAPAFQALAWYIRKAEEAPEVAEQAEFWHEGVCGRCGKALTNPDSIALGLGPKCATKS